MEATRGLVASLGFRPVAPLAWALALAELLGGLALLLGLATPLAAVGLLGAGAVVGARSLRFPRLIRRRAAHA